MRRNVPGTIYLLHFDRPFGHAKHYLGWTEGPLENRLNAHATGNGSKLMSHVTAAGIGFTCVRTWQGDRHLERRLKQRHSPKLCPICSPPKPRHNVRGRDGKFASVVRFFEIVGEAHARGPLNS